MRPARLAEAPDKGRFGSLEEPQGNLQAFLFLELVIDGGQLAEGLTFANIDHHRHLGGFIFGFEGQFVKLAEQSDGKVIDTEVSPVFQRSKKGALSRTAQTSDDDKGVHASGSTLSLAPPWRFREMVLSLERRICFSSLSITVAMEVYISVVTSCP